MGKTKAPRSRISRAGPIFEACLDQAPREVFVRWRQAAGACLDGNLNSSTSLLSPPPFSMGTAPSQLSETTAPFSQRSRGNAPQLHLLLASPRGHRPHPSLHLSALRCERLMMEASPRCRRNDVDRDSHVKIRGSTTPEYCRTTPHLSTT